MRVKLALPVALAALALSGAAWAQQYNIPTNPPANPQGIVPDQRLENIDARLVWVTGQLRDAADTGEEKRIGQALDVSRQTIESIREVFKDLPQERRMPYEEALLKAEQALQGRDPRVVAEAMQALQQRIREITAKGA